MTTFIYALKCPDTGQIRYIGKSDNPTERLRLHIKNCHEEKCHRANWIRSLCQANMYPTLAIIDEVPTETWPHLEIAYIDFFKRCGCDLTNTTLGGEGRNGPLSKDIRKKISASHLALNKKLSPEARVKAIQNLCREITETTRRKISMALSGRPKSLEHRKALSAANLGKKLSLEAKEKLSLAHRGKPKSPEWRRKISIANLGKHFKGGTHASR